MKNPSGGRVFSGGGIAPTILARDYKDPKLILEVKENGSGKDKTSN
nr:MAG TPA: hypothetical protein [Caudoviricetes sp.]